MLAFNNITYEVLFDLFENVKLTYKECEEHGILNKKYMIMKYKHIVDLKFMALSRNKENFQKFLSHENLQEPVSLQKLFDDNLICKNLLKDKPSLFNKILNIDCTGYEYVAFYLLNDFGFKKYTISNNRDIFYLLNWIHYYDNDIENNAFYDFYIKSQNSNIGIFFKRQFGFNKQATYFYCKKLYLGSKILKENFEIISNFIYQNESLYKILESNFNSFLEKINDLKSQNTKKLKINDFTLSVNKKQENKNIIKYKTLGNDDLTCEILRFKELKDLISNNVISKDYFTHYAGISLYEIRKLINLKIVIQHNKWKEIIKKHGNTYLQNLYNAFYKEYKKITNINK